MAEIRSFTLPLFMVSQFIYPHVRKRFGFLGGKIVPVVIYEASKRMALEMAAVIGRARPELIESIVRSHFDYQDDPQRLQTQRSLLVQAADQMRNRVGQETQTFLDFYDIPSSGANAVVDADQAIGLAVLEFLMGLEFGRRYPELTVTLVENKLQDKRGIRKAGVDAGLQLPPGEGPRTYAEWESDILSMVDDWRVRWGQPQQAPGGALT